MKWSEYQNDIFNFVQNGHGNAIIEAVAGSGKSTTIVEAMNMVPQHKSSLFLAFNKAIADELKQRGVNARTFHSLCCGAVMRSRNASNVNADKLNTIMGKRCSDDDNFKYRSFCTRLVSLAKQLGVGCLVDDTEKVWYDIIDHHDLELDKDEAEMPRAVEIASKLLWASNRSNEIDFDDMLYLAVMDGLSLPKSYFIFVDEAQDTNAIQRAILRKIMGPNSRLIAVGDPAQAIYGFRGADSNSLNLIAQEFRCERFPLSVSYRCATSIVEYAHKWVDHIEAADNAPEGKVTEMRTWELNVFQPNDLVVCRTTAPLLDLAFKMLRSKIPVTVMGREIGTSLITLVRKQKTNDLKELIAKIEMWSSRECEKAMAKMQEGKAAAVQDKAGTICLLAEELLDEDDGKDVNSLISTIEWLFTPERNATVLATIHKSKGLEADRVFWLNRSQCPSKWAKQDWQEQQEDNLCYVATTRAKTELILIEMGD